MFTLMLYEFKKMFKDIKNIVCIVFFIAFIIGFVIVNQKIEKNKLDGWQDELQMRLNCTINQIEVTNQTIAQYGGVFDSDTARDLKFLDRQQQLISNLIDEYKSKNLQGYLKADIAVEIHAVEGRKQHVNCQDWQTKEEHEYNIQKLNIFIDKNITPIFEDYCMEGYNFLRLCSSNMMIIILVMLIMILTMESFSSEVEKGTYKLLYIQPISKVKIFFSKFFTRLIVLIVVLGVVIMVGFIILGLKNGFGNLEYPTEMYMNGKVVFVTLREFLHASIPLLITGLLFIFCFCILISCIFNSTSTAISISIPIICICMFAFSPIKRFIPFSYVLVNDFLSSSQFGMMSGNIGGATMLLIGVSFCLVSISLYIIKRKVYKK